MVAHYLQHGFFVFRVSWKGTQYVGHLSRCFVADACHKRGDRGANGATFIGVIRNAHGHQKAADVGIAQPQRSIPIGQLGDFWGGELGHHYGNFEIDGPKPDGVGKGLNIKSRHLPAERLSS